MKRKTTIITLVAILAVLVGVLVWRLKAQKNNPEQRRENRVTLSTANQPKAAPAPSTSQTTIPQPQLFKSTRYPPETPEEKAMWEWWRAMDKADPKFQWKMPIEFYGRVVDQFGEPVSAATVQLTWTAIDDSHQTEMQSDAAGNFQITGVRGKRLGVSLRKVGYLPTKQSGGSFEYAEFSHDWFHVPDQRKPVMFRLQKLMGAEPMLKYITNAEIAVPVEPVLLNVETGKLGSEGDLAFSLTVESGQGQSGPDFTLTIKALDGASFAFSNEEFMFHAPEEAYRTETVFNMRSADPNYSRVQPYRFYVRTRSGKYAAVTGEITIREGVSEGKTGFHAIIYHNPSGSRNLEFDHRKWINR